jgi:hypothetical protein
MLAEKEEMKEAVDQITFGPPNGIWVHHLGHKPIPFELRV